MQQLSKGLRKKKRLLYVADYRVEQVMEQGEKKCRDERRGRAKKKKTKGTGRYLGHSTFGSSSESARTPLPNAR